MKLIEKKIGRIQQELEWNQFGILWVMRAHLQKYNSEEAERERVAIFTFHGIYSVSVP